MINKRRLFLHIGAHKTGSTSIQAFLKKNRKELKSLGWDLFCVKPDGLDSKFGNANSWVEFSGKEEGFEAKINSGIFEFLKKGKSNLILSIEELFWLCDENDITDFYNALINIFAEITVCCYIRRQDLHFLSHFQQSFRFPGSSAQSFFGKELTILPKHKEYYRRYLDYSKKLSYWEKVFGIENMIVKEFSHNKLKEGDAVVDFISLLPFEFSEIIPSKKKSNKSLNVMQTILNFTVFKVRNNLWYELGKGAFTQNESFDYSKKASLSLSQSKKILQNYKDSNIEVKRYIKDLSEDWYDLQKLENKDTNGDCEIKVEDYASSLLALIKYYDGLTIIGFLKIRFRRCLYDSNIHDNTRLFMRTVWKKIRLKFL